AGSFRSGSRARCESILPRATVNSTQASTRGAPGQSDGWLHSFSLVHANREFAEPCTIQQHLVGCLSSIDWEGRSHGPPTSSALSEDRRRCQDARARNQRRGSEEED